MTPASASSSPPTNPPPIALGNRPLAALLAFLVPGLGHIYQGRVGKGILYGVCILSLFVAGMVMGHGQVVYWRWVSPLRDSEHFCFSYLGQFFAGLAALPALIQATLVHYGHEPILGGFMAVPDQNQLNSQYGLGKVVEMASLYTTIAGLLNILAIFDAFEGPANAALDAAEDAAAREAAPTASSNLNPAGVSA